MEAHSLIPGQANQRVVPSDRALQVGQLESQFRRLNQLWDTALGVHWHSTRLPARLDQAECGLKELQKSIDVRHDDLACLREDVDRLVTKEREAHERSARLVRELGEKQNSQSRTRQEQLRLRDETNQYHDESERLAEAIRSSKRRVKECRLKVNVEAAVFANATGVVEPELMCGASGAAERVLFSKEGWRVRPLCGGRGACCLEGAEGGACCLEGGGTIAWGNCPLPISQRGDGCPLKGDAL
ncbi:hypothetical protein GNI_115080 [Gregarina niphandrodes]|uniref:Uncharacterized protein n=1 Tax=Gregarina niphandrodes TaxID=110365 RepID=A0A023B323_GRENI|nr:hypothetical protein GNI_115080 [Gregarina niphandrodes]EZG55279.1 hypothetical protein GNI_115080 [Gregarina niphandrodes]|eukprot:XP_011131658.1 hypothetical protein GNI_115080 [Gregarina niphandrodes]